MPSTPNSPPLASPPISGASSASPSQHSSVPTNTTTTSSNNGLRAIILSLRRHVSANGAATPAGNTFIATTSSQCPTRGSTRGLPHGISASSVSPSPSSTPNLPKANSLSSPAN